MNEPISVTADQDEKIVLADGKVSVSVAFFLELSRRAHERIATLPSGEIVTAQWLLGVPYWRELSPRQRQIAGLCIARLANDRMLPLIRLWSLSRTLAYYQIP